MAKQETVKMVVRDDFGNTLLLEAPTPGHFCYITPNFAENFPRSRGPLKVYEVADFPEDPYADFPFISQAILDNLGKISENELYQMALTGKPPRRN